MNAYQKDQLDDYIIVTEHLASIASEDKQLLLIELDGYLQFRKQIDVFLVDHFTDECTEKCYHSKLSACCGKDSIIIFFADVVVNVLLSKKSDISMIMDRLRQPNSGIKCVYLNGSGCMWKVKPIVCALFLCDRAMDKVFSNEPSLRDVWEGFRRTDKTFRWPDQPVLFDRLEQHFIDAGYQSPSMYLHNSPGLLNVKRRAGLIK